MKKVSRRKFISKSSISITVGLGAGGSFADDHGSADVCVYGATASGVAAATHHAAINTKIEKRVAASWFFVRVYSLV